jgi:hypothetical protein
LPAAQPLASPPPPPPTPTPSIAERFADASATVQAIEATRAAATGWTATDAIAVEAFFRTVRGTSGPAARCAQQAVQGRMRFDEFERRRHQNGEEFAYLLAAILDRCRHETAG